jgi:hypothetical protein
MELLDQSIEEVETEEVLDRLHEMKAHSDNKRKAPAEDAPAHRLLSGGTGAAVEDAMTAASASVEPYATVEPDAPRRAGKLYFFFLENEIFVNYIFV